MQRRSLFFLVLLGLASACSGGGGSTPPLTVPQARLQQQVQTEAQIDAQARALTSAPLSSGSSDLLYIGNTGNNSISVYQHDAKGNTPPLYVISGSKTGLDHPGQLSADAQGNLYVANASRVADASVLVFAHGAKGNIAPVRKIAGSLTGLHSVQAVTVDKSTGKIFVVDSFLVLDTPITPVTTILRFAPNANGNVAPLARSSSRDTPVLQIASDSTGSNLLVVRGCAPGACDQSGLDTVPKQFANNGAFAGPYSIGNFGAAGVADDPTTKSYLASHFNGIIRFSEKTVGWGGDSDDSPPSFTPKPISIITNDTCSGQLAVAPGSTPYTYALHPAGCAGSPNGAVYVYANNASGNATPVRILGGSATLMNQPHGIYEGP